MSDEPRIAPDPPAARNGARLDVRRARRALRLSPARFARVFGFDLEDLRRYERGEPVHDPVERTLLTLIAYDPAMVRRALRLNDPSASP